MFPAFSMEIDRMFVLEEIAFIFLVLPHLHLKLGLTWNVARAFRMDNN